MFSYFSGGVYVNGHNRIISKGALYYTHNVMPEPAFLWCQNQLLESIGDMPLVSVSLKPIDFGKNIVLNEKPGYLTMFKQILAGLEALDTDVVFFCEHDVGYPKEHFEFTPPRKDQYYYNRHWWKVRADGLAVSWEASQVSGLCVYREHALPWYRAKVASFDADNFDRKFEPPGDDSEEYWMSSVPYIDIRGKWNLTYNKWKLDHFRKKETAVNFKTASIKDVPGWDLPSLLPKNY